jgi:hypothetical protein
MTRSDTVTQAIWQTGNSYSLKTAKAGSHARLLSRENVNKTFGRSGNKERIKIKNVLHF